MITKAIAKIKAEMEQKKENSYIQVVGNFLLKHIESYPGSAEMILDPEKTIEKSLGAMEKEAQKKRFKNCAVLTDEEGFAVVMQYFDIKKDNKSALKPDFDVKLEDLLSKE